MISPMLKDELSHSHTLNTHTRTHTHTHTHTYTGNEVCIYYVYTSISGAELKSDTCSCIIGLGVFFVLFGPIIPKFVTCTYKFHHQILPGTGARWLHHNVITAVSVCACVCVCVCVRERENPSARKLQQNLSMDISSYFSTQHRRLIDNEMQYLKAQTVNCLSLPLSFSQ